MRRRATESACAAVAGRISQLEGSVLPFGRKENS